MLNPNHNFFKWVPAILWGLFISWATLKPTSHSDLIIPLWAASLHLDKWVHFGFWFIWTWLFLKKVNPSGLYNLISVAFFSAYGGLIEVLQGTMNLGRTCDIWDWLVDTAGVVVAVIYLKWLNKFIQNKNAPIN
ncbi:MAG: VanZ family protein [Bacteroidia bacterium]|nr:VanZ family protein [Bacteroidia bacterium]